MINITLPDGSVRQYDKGITVMQIALSISEGLARNVLAAEVDGEVWDASRAIEKDSSVKLLTWNDTKGNQPGTHRPT
jgi:threonyl-tRNA synthetase